MGVEMSGLLILLGLFLLLCGWAVWLNHRDMKRIQEWEAWDKATKGEL